MVRSGPEVCVLKSQRSIMMAMFNVTLYICQQINECALNCNKETFSTTYTTGDNVEKVSLFKCLERVKNGSSRCSRLILSCQPLKVEGSFDNFWPANAKNYTMALDSFGGI